LPSAANLATAAAPIIGSSSQSAFLELRSRKRHGLARAVRSRVASSERDELATSSLNLENYRRCERAPVRCPELLKVCLLYTSDAADE